MLHMHKMENPSNQKKNPKQKKHDVNHILETTT